MRCLESRMFAGLTWPEPLEGLETLAAIVNGTEATTKITPLLGACEDSAQPRHVSVQDADAMYVPQEAPVEAPAHTRRHIQGRLRSTLQSTPDRREHSARKMCIKSSPGLNHVTTGQAGRPKTARSASLWRSMRP